MRLTHDQKEQIVNSVWVNGTLESAVNKDISMEMIQSEMKKSAVFKKRIDKAIKESKSMLIDEARALVRDYMRGEYEKTDRNRLTAAIALLNAYEPGFKGTTTVQGKIDHDVRVVTAVPRPNYELPAPKIIIEKPLDKTENKRYNIDKQKLELLNQGASKEKINSVEEAIEGEVIEENINN
jgi:hypothetical protein